MKDKKSIAIDMDGVLADNQSHYLKYYFEETGILLDPSEIHGKPELSCLPGIGTVHRYVLSKNFFRTLPVSKDAVKVVKELQDHYTIYIVSAAMEFPNSLNEKYEWLEEHFPFISWKNIVFCGDKSVINTDYMLDDHIKNLKTFNGKSLLFNSFHNVNELDFERLMDWEQVREYFLNKTK